MPHPRKVDEEKNCLQCQKRLARKRYNGVLESNHPFHKRKFCDQICMAKYQVKERVTIGMLHQRARKYRKNQCEMCGTARGLGVHHKDGNLANNKPDNLMTLCAGCHTKWHWAHGKAMKRKQGFCKMCGQPARKLGMCQLHYQRFRKYGNPLMTKKKIGLQYVLVQEIPSTQNGLASQESQQE